MRLVAATILAALVLVSASPAGAQSGPPEPHESIEATTGTASVETIGPDGLGPVPSPPLGPAWQVGLERSFWSVGEMDLVACDGGFTVLGYVNERRGGRRYRPRALVWTSPNGVEWSRGEALLLRGDPIAGDWTVFDLVEFRGALWALGGDESTPRGVAIARLRPVLAAPPRPAGVLRGPEGDQAQRRPRRRHGRHAARARGAGRKDYNPYQRWAWTLDDETGWRRIRGGLDGVVDFGLVSDGRRFLANREVLVPTPSPRADSITSEDGRRWEEQGVLPDADRPVI